MVPALTLLAGLSMSAAIGTSLMVMLGRRRLVDHSGIVWDVLGVVLAKGSSLRVQGICLLRVSNTWRCFLAGILFWELMFLGSSACLIGVWKRQSFL